MDRSLRRSFFLQAKYLIFWGGAGFLRRTLKNVSFFLSTSSAHYLWASIFVLVKGILGGSSQSTHQLFGWESCHQEGKLTDARFFKDAFNERMSCSIVLGLISSSRRFEFVIRSSKWCTFWCGLSITVKFAKFIYDGCRYNYMISANFI